MKWNCFSTSCHHSHKTTSATSILFIFEGGGEVGGGVLFLFFKVFSFSFFFFWWCSFSNVYIYNLIPKLFCIPYSSSTNLFNISPQYKNKIYAKTSLVTSDFSSFNFIH